MPMILNVIPTFQSYLLYATAAGACAYIAVLQLIKARARKRNPNGLPLPPGPKGYPIIGNLFDFPIDKPWLTYHEWSKVYGQYYDA